MRALARWGGGRFQPFSAGSQPKAAPHPLTLELLRGYRYDVAGLRSKSWDEFSGPDAPRIDFVFTVCDDAAREACPVWPGQPMTAHWGIEDPAAVEGSDDVRQRAFARAFQEIDARIKIFVSRPSTSSTGWRSRNDSRR